MAKIKHVVHEENGVKWHEDQYWYWCLGCGYEHAFSAKVHAFNGDLDNPTVSPSLLSSNPQNYHTCHSFINNGKIQYLGDCWHDLKNQTVELPDIEEKLAEREKKFKEQNSKP